MTTSKPTFSRNNRYKKLSEFATHTKSELVKRMFWGRGSWYKNSFHIVVITITGVLLLTGLFSTRYQVSGQASTLDLAYGAYGNSDLLAQGGSLATVVAVDAATNYTVFNHVVREGETLAKIAKQYGVQQDTILWANSSEISPFNPEVRSGMRIKIPEIDGVLHQVRSGDTVDSIASATNGNRFDIIELNQLVPPNYKLDVGQRIFVPQGSLPPEPLPGLYRDYFDNPLSHPACTGYRFQRGLTSYHSGIDLSKMGGCPIRSIAAGQVVFAGWSDGLSGYTVIVEHGDAEAGNSIRSYYLHGSGEIWVRSGEYVKKGQNLMYMGSTGYSTGTHLHLSIRRNNALVDPAVYVPY